MPVTKGEYEIRPAENGDGFEVYNTVTGKVHSKHADEGAAKHQKQLLYAVGHGWEPTGRGEALLSDLLANQGRFGARP